MLKSHIVTFLTCHNYFIHVQTLKRDRRTVVHNVICIASITFVLVNILQFCKKLIAGKELGITMTYPHRLWRIPQWGIFEKIQIET